MVGSPGSGARRKKAAGQISLVSHLLDHSMLLETELLAKDGSIGVFGDSSQGEVWDNIVADHFLAKCSTIERLHTVYCIVLDRNPNFIRRSGVDKLELCSLEAVEKLVSDGVPKNSALFVYSLSDVIVFHGMRRGIQILELSESFATSVFVIHATLHTIAELTVLKKYIDACVFLHPNDGSMSEEIAIETHTVRRSRTSGKVLERKDLFRFMYGSSNPMKVGSLIPISLRKLSDENSDARQAEEAPGVLEKPTAPSLQELQPRSSYRSRLITFDSNDPEFDDDSDPDHDLDL